MSKRTEIWNMPIAVAVLALQATGAWSAAHAQGIASVRTQAQPVDPSNARSVLNAAADALGLPRTPGVANGSARIDAVNTLEFWASGGTHSEYHASLVYNPPGMRVETTDPKANPQHKIEVVSGKFAWDESELGAGLVPGKGTATPTLKADKERLLWLWTLPYGVVKAGLAAADKTKVSKENGAFVLTFPLAGELAGVTVKATLDAKYLVAKVETKADKPGLENLITETEYSEYADRAEVLTDVQVPGRIVRRRAGKTLLDLRVKMSDTNNPYVIMPVPDSVMKASAQ